MTNLRLTLNPSLRADEPPVYSPLYADETAASWVNRHPDVCLSSDSEKECTFGQLTIDLPEFPSKLQRQLQRAAQPPDAWLLQPHQRTLVCARCLAEDYVQGLPSYDRRVWCVAWRTCCPRHGLLFDTDNGETPPRWISLFDGSRWVGQNLSIVHTRPRKTLLTFSLGADHRAIHLEAAIEGRGRGTWFPKGLNNAALRATYRDIVSDLLHQFDLARDDPENHLPNPGFNRALNGNRFAINVLAEAILSVWTNTPLPTCASKLRTPLLVRAIGWSEGRPPTPRLGQVLFRAPTKRFCSLVRYSQHLRCDDYARLIEAAEVNHPGYLTLPEARLIGLSVSASLRWLTQKTREGQFLAFDARRGCVVENKFLPEQTRLLPPTGFEDVLLPSWAYRSPLSPEQKKWGEELLSFLHPESNKGKMYWTALHRRSRREEKQTTWFFCGRYGGVFTPKGEFDPDE